jgi:hypothetical protein
MLEGCARNADKLWVGCENNSQCTAIAALIRDPSNALRNFGVYLNFPDSSSPDVEQALRDISASLVRNTCLRSLEIIRCRDLRELDCFDKLLCGTSSIETISNSNHTLENIFPFVDIMKKR